MGGCYGGRWRGDVLPLGLEMLAVMIPVEVLPMAVGGFSLVQALRAGICGCWLVTLVTQHAMMKTLAS